MSNNLLLKKKILPFLLRFRSIPPIFVSFRLKTGTSILSLHLYSKYKAEQHWYWSTLWGFLDFQTQKVKVSCWKAHHWGLVGTSNLNWALGWDQRGHSNPPINRTICWIIDQRNNQKCAPNGKLFQQHGWGYSYQNKALCIYGDTGLNHTSFGVDFSLNMSRFLLWSLMALVTSLILTPHSHDNKS